MDAKRKEKKTLLFSKKGVDDARDIFLAWAYMIDNERRQKKNYTTMKKKKKN